MRRSISKAQALRVFLRYDQRLFGLISRLIFSLIAGFYSAAAGKPIGRPSDGQPVKSVVFVQCAGQRDSSGEHLQYCSGYCCNTSIKQATYFKDSIPDIDTVVLFTDLRTPGNGEDFYRSAQNRGVIFPKGVVSSVVPSGGGLTVKFKDLILDEETETAADLVVLALQSRRRRPNMGVAVQSGNRQPHCPRSFQSPDRVRQSFPAQSGNGLCPRQTDSPGAQDHEPPSHLGSRLWRVLDWFGH